MQSQPTARGDSIWIYSGTLGFELCSDRVRKLDYVSTKTKVLLWILGFALVEALVLLIFGIIVIGGAIPAVIVSLLIVSPVQNWLARKRRANSTFSPTVRLEISYQDSNRVEIKGNSVTFKSGKTSLKFHIPKDMKDRVLSLLQSKIDRAILSIK